MEDTTNNQITLVDQTPMALIERATTSGASIDTLERLMDLQERYESNEAKKAYNKAFSEFQSRKPIVVKSKDVLFWDKQEQKHKKAYSYTPLEYYQKLVDPLLSEFGFSYRFEQEEKEGRITISFILNHELGHAEKTSLSASPDASGGKNAIQAIGSAVTYLKRYTFCNGLGISSEQDDDGVSSSLTKEEKREILKSRLKELAAKKEMDEKIENYVSDIIANESYSRYQKAINHLKTLPDKK